MARSYPEHPSFPEDGGAEQRVWEALCEHLPDDAVVLAGTLLQDGAIEREIDLLVVWPGLGVAAIEVKGGHVTRADGQWWQGSGEHRHAIDPVGQVQSAKHTLLRLLDRQGLAAARTRTAHLVALPHVYVPAPWDAPELPRTMLLDRDDVTDGSAAVRVIRRAIEDHGTGHAPLDEVAAEALVGWLTGGFPSQAEALADAAQYEDHLDRLTREQAHAMRYLDALPRVHVVGGAGTGKTWLALEHARRRARAGDRVALMCYSRGLARYLERATATWPARERPAYVGLFHELPVRWGATPGDDRDPADWEERLPRELGDLAAQRAADELFDAVVVDEAQDFGDAWWPALLRCLRDPDAGRLAVFSDDGQRVFPRSGTAPVELTVITLDENLRSTKQIAQLCGALHTGITRPRGWAGAPVRVVDVPADDAVGAADDAVDALLAEGWEPGQIALLTTGRRHPLQVETVELAGHREYWDGFFGGQDVFYGHVLGFKGLERTVVVLAVNGVRDAERARTMLYTGLSRARVLLVVVGPRGYVEEVGGEAVRMRLRDAWEWVPSDPL
ncbi:NERD domain-containing protein [Cellulomonas sp. CW35]|uniref:NERD domain-containing protein n=1 Tax=Cellulomonas sp. CW35 TaxID=3458249 RepID=UPI004033E93C